MEFIFAPLSVSALIPLRVLLTKVDEFSNHSSGLQRILLTFLCFSLSYAFLANPSLHELKRDYTVLFPPVWYFPYLGLVLCYTLLEITDDPEPNNLFVIVVLRLLVVSFLGTLGALCCILELIFCSDPHPLETIANFLYWLVWVIFIGLTTIIYHEDHTIKIEFDNPFLPYVVCPTLGYLLRTYQFRVSMHVPWGIKIILGIVGSILTNHYLKDKGFPLFWLIVCFAIFLMGNIAMMHSTCHTAIFGFFAGAIVDIAGEIFGIMNILLWLVGAVCVALLFFFEHLDKLNRRNYSSHTRKEKVDE